MDAILDQFKKPIVLVALAGAFFVGLLFGLVVLGWGLWPVTWTDAAPADLQADYQVDYMRMAVQAFQVNADVFTAKQRWDALGTDKAATAMLIIKTDPKGLSPEVIRAFEAAVMAPQTQQANPTQSPSGQNRSSGSPLWMLLIILLVLTLLLGGVLLAIFLLRQRSTGPRTVTPAMQANEAARQAQYTDFSTNESGSPLAQFMASYKVGDDLFDDSFSIDSASGEFLGECGVGISEPIGVGDPKKVTAFEVWMFDKNDIQTITKVLMSNHAFNDSGLRNKLATKGEPFLAEPGGQTVLETATLRLTARIVDMNYGEGALPPQSFFDTLIIELAVWQKA